MFDPLTILIEYENVVTHTNIFNKVKHVGLVVSMLAFYFDETGSNTVELDSFSSLKNCFRLNE